MARTPLLSLLRRSMFDRGAALRRGVPVEAILEERSRRLVSAGPTRRQFLLGTAAALGALPFAAACRSGSDASSGPRVAVVGGGIAGLSCALALKDKGVLATVYEHSSHRVGGRMVSERGSEPTGCNSCHAAPSTAPRMSWMDSQVTDIYGELIDTGHVTVQALATRFGLPLVDALGAQPVGTTETLYFGGGYYLPADVDADFAAIYAALQKDAEDAGWPVTYDTATAAARALDAMSITDWIAARVPGGATSRLGKLLDVAYRMEYGAEPSDQSALNLISMLSGSPEELAVLGESDEKYRIAGGVDQLPRAIAAHLGLGSNVLLGWSMQALRVESDGSYTLTFDANGSTKEVRADYVVLALPFARLRALDVSKAGFDALKLRAINEQGAGRNAKVQLQFTKRLWNESGPWGKSGGTSYSDTGYQLAWEPTRGQAGASGILAGYFGGAAAVAAKLDHPYGNQGNPTAVQDGQKFLSQLEPVFPGLTALWNGKVAASLAHLDPRFNGSYAYYRVGQTQLFGGYERVPQKNVYFCGEHTSIESLGFMEGAASEGLATAESLLVALGILATPTSLRRAKL